MAIEKEGIPTVTLTLSGFQSLVQRIREFEGMPDLATIDMAPNTPSTQAEADKLVNDHLDEIVNALTRGKGSTGPAVAAGKEQFLEFTGNSEGEVLEAVSSEFVKRQWTDGLPIVPPTEERIQWMLKGTDLAPDYSFGVIEPRKANATVRDIAINAVMAGARPEYMPVILAMVEGLADPKFFWSGYQATGNEGAEMVIVSGPIAQKLSFYSGGGLLGPGWRPNYTLGRTMRLIGINLGGAWPGFNKMSQWLPSGRGGDWVFTEAADKLPQGWNPLHVMLGFKATDSVVTLMVLDHPEWTEPYGEPSASGCAADAFVEAAKADSAHSRYTMTGESLLIISPNCAKLIASKGYTKEKIQEYMFAKARLPLKQSMANQTNLPQWIRDLKVGDLAPVHVTKAEDLVIAVAGGTAFSPGWAEYFGSWSLGSHMVSHQLDKYMPKNFDELLKQAQK